MQLKEQGFVVSVYWIPAEKHQHQHGESDVTDGEHSHHDISDETPGGEHGHHHITDETPGGEHAHHDITDETPGGEQYADVTDVTPGYEGYNNGELNTEDPWKSKGHSKVLVNTTWEEHMEDHGEEHGDDHDEEHVEDHGEEYSDDHGEEHSDGHGEEHSDSHGEEHSDGHGEEHSDDHGKASESSRMIQMKKELANEAENSRGRTFNFLEDTFKISVHKILMFAAIFVFFLAH